MRQIKTISAQFVFILSLSQHINAIIFNPRQYILLKQYVKTIMLKYIYHKLLNTFAMSIPLRKLLKFTYLKVINLGILDIAAFIVIYFHFEIIHDAKYISILYVDY